MELRDYLLRIQKDVKAALALVPAAPAPPGPVTVPGAAVAPQAYPWLRVDRAMLAPLPLPQPAPGAFVVDPQFVVDPAQPPRLWRVTGTPGQQWGTLSAPNQCQVSADDRMFLAMGEDGTVDFYDSDPASTVAPFRRRGTAPLFLTEPTFSHVRPGVVYAPHYGYVITEFDAATGKRTTLFDVQQDVGPLTQSLDQYMGACYSSATSPEVVACAYGATQEAHPYVTVLRDAGNPARRVTLDIVRSRLRVDGAPWAPLLNRDGTPADLQASWAAALAANPNLSGALGIHSISLDKSGTLLRVDIKGNGFFCFFDLTTLRILQWPQAGAVGNATFFGHYCWGDRYLVRGICAPGDAGQYQWLISDFRSGAVPPPYRRLIATPPKNNEQYEDHSNWNHYRMDGTLVPVLSGTQPGEAQTQPHYLDGQLVLVATALGAPAEHYRVGHHRCVWMPGEFRSSPRVQAFRSGRAGLFTSNWGDPAAPRDLYMAQW